MHWLSWVFIATLFGVSYRLGYKLISDKFSPFLSIAIITMLVSLICFTIYFWKDYSKLEMEGFDWKSLWPLPVIAIVVAGLEISIMMIYRSGGPISIAQSLASGLVGLSVFVIGVIFFKDQLNTGQIVGFIITLIGATTLTFFSR